MLKVGPSRSTGCAWDHKGKTEIAEIIISRSATCINFIHFVYVEVGGNKLVLSDKCGVDYGGTISLNTIRLDYPNEVITGITGKYQATGNYNSTRRLISLTVVTNKCKYGPFEVKQTDHGVKVISETEFEYDMGYKQFGGFFGANSSDGIESIGIYLKPIEKLPINNPIKTE